MTARFTTRFRTLNWSALLLASFILPYAAYAATTSFAVVPQQPAAGSPFTVTIDFASGPDSVNAVDGSISIPEGIDVIAVQKGDSLMSLWPVEPLYVMSDHKIEFAGGIPDGIPVGARGKLFSFTAVATNAGPYEFSTGAMSAYRNDGTGTRLPIPASRLAITIAPSGGAAAPAASTDTAPPVFSAVAVGRDPSLFNDQYFVTFFANDAGSGIDHYEVREGWWRSFVRADRYYVLRDQSLGTAITVRAIDKAGNVATYTIPATHPSRALLYAVCVLLILGIGFFIARRRRRQR